jgi:Na+/H+ antiporter NhaD/arsenite permease-like protein
MVQISFSREAYILQISDMPNLCITFLSKKSFGVFMATFYYNKRANYYVILVLNVDTIQLQSVLSNLEYTKKKRKKEEFKVHNNVTCYILLEVASQVCECGN